MSIDLSFQALFDYDTLASGITLPIHIVSGNLVAAFEAKLDTGASHCIFQRNHAERIGLQVEAGEPFRFSTATGMFSAFAHEITLTVLGIEVFSKVYFAADENFPRNVLGRIGWLDRVQLGLIDYEGKLFLSPYSATIN